MQLSKDAVCTLYTYCMLFDFIFHIIFGLGNPGAHAICFLHPIVFFYFLKLLKMFETADFGEGVWNAIDDFPTVQNGDQLSL